MDFSFGPPEECIHEGEDYRRYQAKRHRCFEGVLQSILAERCVGISDCRYAPKYFTGHDDSEK